jgi:hypothetical protein
MLCHCICFFKDMGGTIMFNTVEQKPAMNSSFFSWGVGCRCCGSVNICKESDSEKPVRFKSGTVVWYFTFFDQEQWYFTCFDQEKWYFTFFGSENLILKSGEQWYFTFFGSANFLFRNSDISLFSEAIIFIFGTVSFHFFRKRLF